MPDPCAVCRAPSISYCPYCLQPVHGGYGMSGTCALAHEAECSGAREARLAPRPEPEPDWMSILEEDPEGGPDAFAGDVAVPAVPDGGGERA